MKQVALFLIISMVALNQADLKSDLREFRPLIPRTRIGYIAARHFILDSHFRQALSYVRGQEFASTWQQIRDTPEFAEIVAFVAVNGSNYDVTQIVDTVPNRLRSYSLPAQVPVELLVQRNLSTFLREVLSTLPRARISSLMARKVKEGGDFAQLYAAVRQEEFRQLVDTARNSANLALPLAQLEQHGIDVDELIEIAFSVVSWGP